MTIEELEAQVIPLDEKEEEKEVSCGGDDDDDDDFETDLIDALKLLEEAAALVELALDKDIGCKLSPVIEREARIFVHDSEAFLQQFQETEGCS